MTPHESDARLCIWCGMEYRHGEAGSDECFCFVCLTLQSHSELCAARLAWITKKTNWSSALESHLGHSPNDAWPDEFPAGHRSEKPSSKSSPNHLQNSIQVPG